jgi:hypothetical protein
VTRIPMTATEALAECNQLLRREQDAAVQGKPQLLSRRQHAAIAKLMELAMPEALGQRTPDPQRRHHQ